MIDWWGPTFMSSMAVPKAAWAPLATGRMAGPSGHSWPAVGNTTLQIIREMGPRRRQMKSGRFTCGPLDYPEFTYPGDPRKRRSIEHNGLITNGDIGYLDHEGYLYLCDRARDMIISGV
ncbi:MAG: hypothetical protein CM1200mP20_12150 [Pseudomonadota bacterium]|nr:MAG: hypothetical protein CM1200mP20_12150 [Pseudomonadota bacterium]